MPKNNNAFVDMVTAYLTPGSARPEQNVIVEIPKSLLPLLHAKLTCEGTIGHSKEDRDLERIVLDAMVNGEHIQRQR